MKNKYYVYAHTRPDTREYFYIGLGFGNRAYCKSGRNIYWHRIVEKNEGRFTISILKRNMTREDAQIMEKSLIKLYGRKDLKEGILCNMSDGGETNKGLNITEETRSKLRSKMSGKNHPQYGKHKSMETRLRISNTKTGVKLSEEHKLRISMSHKNRYDSGIPHHSKGKKLSEEHKRKTSESLRGQKRSKETKRKQMLSSITSGQAKRCIVYKLETMGRVGEFPTISEACRQLGIYYMNSKAVMVANGKRKQTKGYVFRYI